jgi:hypothetical protein
MEAYARVEAELRERLQNGLSELELRGPWTTANRKP